MNPSVHARKNLGTDPIELEDYGDGAGNGEITWEDLEGPPENRYEPGQTAPRGPATLADVEAYVDFLAELLDSSGLESTARASLERELERLEKKAGFAEFLQGESREQALHAIHQQLFEIETQIPEPGELSQETAPDAKAALDGYLEEVEGMKNLAEDEKTAFIVQLEKWKKELELTPEAAEKILANLEDLKADAVEKNVYSPTLKGLSRALQMDPETIQAKASTHGLDLETLRNPPSPEFFEFLAECSPEFKAMLQDVQGSVDERMVQYEKLKHEAAGQSAHNKGGNDSNENDIKEFTVWQKLFDLKYHQDDYSKKVVADMNAVAKFLIPILQEIFPNEDVRSPEASGSGWERQHAQYGLADKILIGSVALDLFASGDGSLRASTSPDPEPELEIPKMEYDAEGDGAWDAPTDSASVQGYAENMGEYLHNYDADKNDNDGVDDAD